MNAALMHKYMGSELGPDLLRMINRHMAEYIRAGLTFGDISLVSPEITWARAMISNNAIAQEYVNDYLDHLSPFFVLVKCLTTIPSHK